MPEYRIVAFPKIPSREIEIGKVTGHILSLEESLSRIGRHLCIIFEDHFSDRVLGKDSSFIPRRIYYESNIVESVHIGDQMAFTFETEVIAKSIYDILNKFYARYFVHYENPYPFSVKIDETNPCVLSIGNMLDVMLTSSDYYRLNDIEFVDISVMGDLKTAAE